MSGGCEEAFPGQGVVLQREWADRGEQEQAALIAAPPRLPLVGMAVPCGGIWGNHGRCWLKLPFLGVQSGDVRVVTSNPETASFPW